MPPKKGKGNSSASASYNPPSLEHLLERVDQIEGDPSLNNEKNIGKILGALDEAFDAVPTNAKKQSAAEKLIKEITERCEALKALREAKSAARKQEPMFGLILNYGESTASAVLPHNHPFCALGKKHEAVRAHLIPVQAVRSATMRMESEIEIAKGDDETNVLKQKFKRGIRGAYEHNSNDIANLIPCLVIPKHLEEYIDTIIRDYAIECSKTGSRSNNRPKETSTSAITNESEFAAQHPDVYLEIFGSALETLPTGPSFDEQDKAQLIKNFSTGVAILRDVSARVFPESTGLFGTTLAERSRSRSETEGKDEFREVEAHRPPPSREGFVEFATAHNLPVLENSFIAASSKNDPADKSANINFASSNDGLDDEEKESPTGDVSPRLVRKGSISGNNKPLIGGADNANYDDEKLEMNK